MKLYEISNTLLEIERRIAEAREAGDEIKEGALEEALAEWGEDFDAKMISIGGLIGSLQAEADAMKEIIKRRQEAMKAIENRIEHLAGYGLAMMKRTGREEVKSADMRVRIKYGTGSVVIDDESLVEADYKRIIPASWQLDKAAMRTALLTKKKADEPTIIPGAHLEFSEKLEIK